MTDDDAERQRRAQMNSKWAAARRKAKREGTPSVRSVFVARSQTRKQVASRTQRAASEALAELKRRQGD